MRGACPTRLRVNAAHGGVLLLVVLAALLLREIASDSTVVT